MAFDIKQQFPNDLNSRKAIGIDLPLNGNAVFKPNYQTKDAIKSGLINFFLTNPGERYLNPLFGGGLREFIFEQIADDNIATLDENTRNKIEDFFPSIQIIELKVLQTPNTNQIVITFKYSIKNTNIEDELTIQI
tara:strand:- start:139 stop:543 length:405 start_codon:yes stop_codon:yes gene_type:complete